MSEVAIMASNIGYTIINGEFVLGFRIEKNDSRGNESQQIRIARVYTQVSQRNEKTWPHHSASAQQQQNQR